MEKDVISAKIQKLSTKLINQLNKEFNLNLYTVDLCDMDEFIKNIICQHLKQKFEFWRKNSNYINLTEENDLLNSI